MPALSPFLARGLALSACPHRASWILSLGLVALLSACSSPPPPAAHLDCPPATRLVDTALSLHSARAAYLRAEESRELRFREAQEPGYLLRSTREIVSQGKIDGRAVCLDQIVDVGRLLFEHEYGFADGLGRDDASKRPDPFRRVHQGELGGPETNSCTSCHWRGGPAGAGAVQDNSLIMGDGINTDSADARNPPPLQGSGVVQALAQEMSAELQEQLAAGLAAARKQGKAQRIELHAKGIGFGSLRISAKGAVDSSELKGVDADLIIKPFGWRGQFATLRDFVATSTQVHLGMQSEDLLRIKSAAQLGGGPSEDPDKDGIRDELSAGQLSALVMYLATLEMPIIAAPEVLRGAKPAAPGLRAPLEHDFYDRFAEGQRLFDNIGCTACHTPMLILRSPIFTTVSAVSGKPYRIDLSQEGQEPRLRYEPSLGGYPVWLFSDLKRHDIGSESGAKHAPAGLAAGEFLSRRLWGLANSAPYFYDGRAQTITAAVEAHGGEASYARDEFRELTSVEKGSLRLYLLSLRRSPTFLVP